MIAYSIEAALHSRLFSEVMVSTDSRKIAETAQFYGAKIPFFRSSKNSDDHATTADVILEVLQAYRERGQEFDTVCCIYPTAPFLTAEKLKTAIQLMEDPPQEKHPAAVIPVAPFSYPPQRCFMINKEQYAEYKYPEYIQTRSQDLEKLYHDAGQFYIYQSSVFLKNYGRVTKDILPMVLSEMEVQDIDNEDDWKLAELKYRLLCAARQNGE